MKYVKVYLNGSIDQVIEEDTVGLTVDKKALLSLQQRKEETSLEILENVKLIVSVMEDTNIGLLWK